MTKFEALARIFVNEAEREAKNCLPFLLATLRPLDGKFFETLEAEKLAREKLNYGCSYWFVREILICGVQTGALEFLNGRFRLKGDWSEQVIDVEAWRESVTKYFDFKKKIHVLESIMGGRPPKEIFQDKQAAAKKLAENFSPLPNNSSVLLVNRAHPLPNDYVAENLIELSNVPRHFLLEKDGMRLAEPAYRAAEEMFTAAAEKNLHGFLILSAYRDRAVQTESFAHGTPGYVAEPGTSEHETGLAMDISVETGDETFFEHTPHFDWLTEHAHEFGFIRRYPKFKEKFTGVFYEPHHYRYVGKEVASALHDGGLSLEEYCAGEVEQPARQSSSASSSVYDPREIYRSIFGEKMRGHGQRWPNIDLPLLKSLNPDTVGWIYLAKSPISYPVVRAREDKNFYLRHNFSGEESIHGAITMVGDKLGRYNTLFGGHHMKDWSMFCAVAELDEQKYFDTHSTFGLLIDGRRFDVEIFSCFGYWSGDMRTERTDFEDDDDFAWWLKNIRARSRIKSDVAVTAQDSVVTFSTCAYPTEGGFDQYAAYGVLRERDDDNPAP